jgi:DinB superfamily
MTESARRQRDDLLAILVAVPERVADLVTAFDQPRLDYRHAPAFPTLRELVGHFRATGSAVDAVLRRVCLDGEREIRAREAVEAKGDSQSSTPVPEAIEDFTRVRRRTVDLLRGLSPADWKRPLLDPAAGEVTLQEVCDMAARHELGHLAQIRNLATLLPDP